MKNYFFLLTLCLSFGFFGQNRSSDMPGPTNMGPNNIIDGVVLADEVPVRSAISYEHVRLADYVWSKRVFSRIDSREKINHELFYPYDAFDPEFILKSDYDLTVNDSHWVRHHERYSLWTIILKHIFKGDLRIFYPYDPITNKRDNPVRDGYQFKYPVSAAAAINNSSDGDAFFNDKVFQSSVLKRISNFKQGQTFTLINEFAEEFTIIKTNQTFQDVFGNPATLELIDGAGDKINLQDFIDYGDETEGKLREQMEAFEKSWDYTDVGKELETAPTIAILNSQAIVAYNIKEDWFFDKERSILDKRIIGIAPVAEYAVTLDTKNNPSTIADESNIIYIDPESGGKFNNQIEYKGSKFQSEMFWLYFPDLRRVIVNYYTYNEKSDANWMSFDDLFWKRKFSALIYRTSDKFDREIEDYRFGVDALREAEKIKGEIRKWEHDVWNY
jgi:hypothetical protein